ncbi:TM1812 family CRISPR-associated protein [Thermovibrio ammonificans]|uniref:TM1812 family CRISPR-associated protein n=1 Tax=Thermovibrio ammonificans TaxID=228745 RepID=UPI00059BEE75|nr:hypothetical protein [Thermovibrio ammonificans]
MKFVAYNADPVVTGVADSNINVVEEALLIPKISLERTLKDKRSFVKTNHSELRRSCRENKLEELYILYGSLAFGLPLLLAEEALSIKRFYEGLNEVLERCVSDYRRLTECTYEDGTFSVKRSGTFQDSVRVAVFAFSVLESLCSVVRLLEGEGVPYNDYLANSDKQEQKESDDKRKDRAHPDKRNFFAHAGFERNVVELKRSSTGEILLRYRPDRKKTVKKFVREEMERFALLE